MWNPKSSRLTFWYLLGLGLPIWIVFAIATQEFDGLYGQDSYAYYNYAATLLPEALLTDGSLPYLFWPPGYPIIVCLAIQIMGEAPRVAQCVSVIAGASIPLLIGLLVQEVWSGQQNCRAIAILAGLLVALAGQVWQSSIVVMSDALALASGTLGAWALIRFGNSQIKERVTPALFWLVLATSSISFAVLCRWVYGLLALPST